jgi:uncharacterized protein YgfB (UPF0149 family)
MRNYLPLKRTACASGMLAIDASCSGYQWLSELLRHASPISNEHRQYLIEFYEDTQDVLMHDEFEFDLCLADDASDLSERLDSLRQWCQGFLVGVGFANTTTQFSIQTQEILKDVIEITKLDVDVEDDQDAKMILWNLLNIYVQRF